MATSKNNLILQSLSGKIGNIIIKNYKGKAVISKIPDMSNVVKTEQQLENQDRFQAAQAYAKSIINDPIKKSEYLKAIPEGKTVYHAALSKYLKENKTN